MYIDQTKLQGKSQAGNQDVAFNVISVENGDMFKGSSSRCTYLNRKNGENLQFKSKQHRNETKNFVA